MSRSVRDQMLDKGLVKLEETPEARRAAARAAVPVEEKGFAPLFEAPARGKIVASSHRAAVVPTCVECSRPLPGAQRLVNGDYRCAECAANP